MNLGIPIRSYNDDSNLYISSWDVLSQYPIRNWHLNRPHDESRIPDIMKLLKTQDYVDGVIYLSKDDEGGLICYDGIHRIESLKTLSQLKLGFNHSMIIHVLSDYDDVKIRDKFDSLNKCIPVPEIYSEANRELDCKQLVENIVKHYTSTYPLMFKPAKNPRLPHENRDRFTDRITHIIKDHNLGEFSCNKIVALLDELNDLMSRHSSSIKLTSKQREKCETYRMFMFSRKDWVNVFDHAYLNKSISLKRL